jgi:hypothetical protein
MSIEDICREEAVRIRAAALDLLEAAQLLEAAETANSNCPECDGEGTPELCPICFPLFDSARVKRRLAIAKAVGGERCRDVLPPEPERNQP